MYYAETLSVTEENWKCSEA